MLFKKIITKFNIFKLHIIKLDEIIEMELNDFYDEVHTTPKGSEKIANAIYPLLREILIK